MVRDGYNCDLGNIRGGRSSGSSSSGGVGSVWSSLRSDRRTQRGSPMWRQARRMNDDEDGGGFVGRPRSGTVCRGGGGGGRVQQQPVATITEVPLRFSTTEYASTSFGGDVGVGGGRDDGSVAAAVEPSTSTVSAGLPVSASTSRRRYPASAAVLSSRNRRNAYAAISLCLERRRPGILLCVLICGMLSLSLFISYAVVQQAKSSSGDGVNGWRVGVDGVQPLSRAAASQQFRFAPPPPDFIFLPTTTTTINSWPQQPSTTTVTATTTTAATTARSAVTESPLRNDCTDHKQEILVDKRMSDDEKEDYNPDDDDDDDDDDYSYDSQQPHHIRMAEPRSESREGNNDDDDDDDDGDYDEIFIAIPSLRDSQFAYSSTSNNNSSSSSSSSSSSDTTKKFRLNSVLLNRLLNALTARRNITSADGTVDSVEAEPVGTADLTVHPTASRVRIDDFRRGRKSDQLAIRTPLESVGDHIVVNGSSVFEVMHRLWSTEEPNANRITPERCVRRLNGTCVKYRLRKQRFVLNIFWTLDQDSIPPDTVFYALYRDNRAQPNRNNNNNDDDDDDEKNSRQQPQSQQPTFVDISRYLTQHQKIGLLRNAISDSLEEWSSSFDYRVVFQELPYSQLQADSEEFNRVVVIAFHSLKHTDEHTSANDDFTSEQTIAHASFNVLHLNDAYRYYLVPRPVTRKVPVMFRNSPKRMSERDGEYELFMLGGTAFHDHFNTSYRQLYPTVRPPRPMKIMTNLAAVLSHEIGHILGLSHFVGRLATGESGSSVNAVVFDDRVDGGTSMMASYYNENVTMLTPIDKMAINQLFAPLIEKSRTLEKSLH